MFSFKREDNSKIKLLFIHGYASSGASINAIRPLKRDFDIISINLPFTGENISLEYYIKYINDFIKQEKISDFVVMGHSLGGAIAMGIQGAKKRILIAPLNPFADPYKKLLVPEGLADAKESIINLVHKLTWTDKQIEMMARQHLVFSEKNKDDLHYIINNQILNNDFLKKEIGDLYSKGNFTIIQGIQDKYISLESSEKTVKKYCGDLIKIDSCGHSPIFENPKEIVDLLNKIIKDS